jgi:N-acetylmuramoyl-L-alanine amidase
VGFSRNSEWLAHRDGEARGYGPIAYEMRPLPVLVAIVLCSSNLTAKERSGLPPKHIVALDIGHTPARPGAISATGIPEFRFNKEVVEKISVALAATDTIEPFVVTSPQPLTLVGRTRIAAANKAELFVAIHHDSVQDKYLHVWEVDGKPQRYCDDFSGYSVFFSRRNAQPESSFELARLLGRQMATEGFKFARHHAEPIQGENREIVDEKAGVYRFDNLVVLRTAPMPAALLECGVILNRIEEKSLRTSMRQEKIANAVSMAIVEYFAKPRPVRPQASPTLKSKPSIEIQDSAEKLEPEEPEP